MALSVGGGTKGGGEEEEGGRGVGGSRGGRRGGGGRFRGMESVSTYNVGSILLSYLLSFYHTNKSCRPRLCKKTMTYIGLDTE